MKPAAFKYALPRTLDEALAVKAEHGDEAMFLAGGQSLIPAMNFRLAQPAVLIDINAIEELAFIRVDEDGGDLRLGALTRHRDLQFDPLIAACQPLVHEAAPNVAHQQIRNRGTLCGNLVHADPASELPAVMLALDARLRLQSNAGERWLAARDFFLSVFTTARDDDEMLVEVALPAAAPRTGTCFLEITRRPGDYAMMGVAAVLVLDDEGICSDARLVYCSAGETPVAARAAAAALVGGRITDDGIAAAADQAKQEIAPVGSVHASIEFQRHLAGVVTRRALGQALARASAAEPGATP
jgi:carbon-monoxide dehydrogenase medium subunit